MMLIKGLSKKIINLPYFEYGVLTLIVVMALIVRLYKIDSPIADWHSWRQADTSSVSRTFVKDGINLLYPQYHDLSSTQTSYENPRGLRYVEFPVFNAAHALLYKLYPNWSLEMWGRLLSVLFSLVSVVMMFLLGRRFFDLPAQAGSAGPDSIGVGGLLAAFFFAFLPFNIYFSRVILPEPMAVAFILVSLWFFIRWIDGKWAINIFVSAFFFAMALLLKPYIGFYALPMVYLAVVKFGLVGWLKQPKLWIFLSLSLIPFLSWRIWMNQITNLVGIPHWQWAFNGDNIRFRPAWWYWIFSARLGQLILGIGAVLPFLFGMVNKAKAFPYIVHIFVASQILYMTVVATASVRHDYYQTLIIPAVCLSLAYGTLLLWNLKEFNKFLTRGILITSILIGFALSAYQVKEYYKINHPEIITAGAAVQRLTPPDARIIAPYNGDTAFLYQTNRNGWPFVTLPMEYMIKRLGAEYYVSVNFDKQTQEVMEQYKVLEKTDQYVIVKLF